MGFTRGSIRAEYLRISVARLVQVVVLPLHEPGRGAVPPGPKREDAQRRAEADANLRGCAAASRGYSAGARRSVIGFRRVEAGPGFSPRV